MNLALDNGLIIYQLLDHMFDNIQERQHYHEPNVSNSEHGSQHASSYSKKQGCQQL